MAYTDTLDDIIRKVLQKTSQTTSITDTNDEYTLIRGFVNESNEEGWKASDWRFKYTEFNTRTSTSTGNTSIALPTNFDELFGFPFITEDGTNTYEFAEIDPYTRQGQGSQRYCYTLKGGTSNTLIVNPRTSDGWLSSGASIRVPYRRSLASLASPADKPDFIHSDFIVERTIAHLWEAREDARFTRSEAKADKILARLVEDENSRSPGYDNEISMPEERNFSFRLGRD